MECSGMAFYISQILYNKQQEIKSTTTRPYKSYPNIGYVSMSQQEMALMPTLFIYPVIYGW